jgi:RNA polymerase sigma-70 factor, ECF subfamily
MADTAIPGGRRFTIVVRGRMSERLGAAFHGMTLERHPGRTVIHGRADRARLDELLEALADLGLEPAVRDEGTRRQLTPSGDDAAVVASLRDGGETTFVALVRSQHGLLHRTAMTYVSSRAVADEVVEETWLAVLDGLDRFEGRSSLRTWIFRIAVDIARARAVREGRCRPFSSLRGDHDPRGPAVAPERFRPANHRAWPGHWACPPVAWETPEERRLSRETQDVIRGAIARLPASQQLVVSLRDVEGWTAEEVSDALDLRAVNQRVLLHRARSEVRDALERHLGAAENAA